MQVCDVIKKVVYAEEIEESRKKVLEALSERLTNKFGKGWTVESLTLTRKFYKTYSNSVNTVYQIQNSPAEPHKFVLSWSHYLVLMRNNAPHVCERHFVAVRKGLEPSTSGVTGRHSNQTELPHQLVLLVRKRMQI